MKTFLDRLDNLMNPIVVKELRQAVSGKFVTGVLMLFITVQLVTIGFALFAFNVDRQGYGGDTFLWLLGVMLVTCMLFVPGYAATRLVAERSGTQQDLLYITTIRPGQIVAGKFLSAMMVVVLIYAACMPFLSLTYLLRGIDLPTIFLLLFIDFLVIAMATMFAIFLACIPATRGLRSLIGLAGFGAMIMVLSFAMAFAAQLVQFGGGIGWTAIFAVVVAILAIVGLMHFLSVALVSSVSANRALPVRIYITVVWLVTGVVMAWWSVEANNFFPVALWGLVMVLVLLIALLVAISERDQLSGRLRRTIPRNFALRSVAFFFYSGAAGGMAWTLGMLAITIGFGWLWLDLYRNTMGGSSDTYTLLKTGTPFAMYMTAYALTALFIRRELLWWLIYPAFTWALALIMMAAGIILPFVLAFILHGYDWESEMSEAYGMFATVPFMPFVWSKADAMGVWWWTAGSWALLAYISHRLWWWRRFLAFRPDIVAAGARDGALAAEQLGDDGVEHPQSLRFWVHENDDGARVFGVADSRVFWAGVSPAEWTRVRSHLDAGRLPLYLLRDLGRVVPVDAVTRVKTVVRDTAVDIDFTEGARTLYTRVRAADLADRDAFLRSLQDITNVEAQVRSVRLVSSTVAPGLMLAAIGLFTWACWSVIAEVQANPAMEFVIRTNARGFKALIFRLVDLLGQTGLMAACVTMLLAVAGWLVWVMTRQRQMLVIEPPAVPQPAPAMTE